nr:hypothetical protein [Tanacetum cinerariifolium]
MVHSASKSSGIKNKEVEVEEHHRNLLLSKKKKHMSFECNNVKPATRNAKTEVVCAMCKQCLITANHDVCVLKYVNDMNSRGGHQLEEFLTVMVIQIYLWCIESGCSKHMTGNLKLLINFIWKFLGTFCFGNDHVAAILGFGDLQWGNILITRVYFVEGLRHNLFSGNHTTNLYTINLHEMASNSPICLMAHATSTKSCLWHQRLSHPNFDTINDLSKNDLVTGLPKFKYHKEHLCPSFLLHAHVINVRTNNDTEFKNQVLQEFFSSVGMSHQASSVRTPKQNEVVERRNRTLVEAARKMLVYRYSYGLKQLLLHVTLKTAPSFTNDHEDIGKHGAKGDIGFFIKYSVNSCAYRVYNRRTNKIMETINVTFDELSAMAFEQHRLDLTYDSSTITTQQPTERKLDLLFKAMYDDYIGGQPSATTKTVSVTQAPQVLQTPTASTTTADTTPTPTNSSFQATHIPNTSQDVNELKTQQQHVQQQNNQASL